MLLIFNPMHLKTCNKNTHTYICVSHDDVIKWKHFPRYWPFVRGIHRLPVNSPHKGQWHGALMVPLVCAWINGWANNLKAGDLRRHRAHYDVIAMCVRVFTLSHNTFARFKEAVTQIRWSVLHCQERCTIALRKSLLLDSVSIPLLLNTSPQLHYNDVIMGVIVSPITSLTIVYSIVYSDADQRKHQSSASLASVRGIHRGPVNSPHKWPVTAQMIPFNDVIMCADQVSAMFFINGSL